MISPQPTTLRLRPSRKRRWMTSGELQTLAAPPSQTGRPSRTHSIGTPRAVGPVLFVLDEDPASLDVILSDLIRRFGNDFTVTGERSPEAYVVCLGKLRVPPACRRMRPWRLMLRSATGESPFAPQERVDPECAPFVLEPVGLDEAPLAAESQPCEQPLRRLVTVVDLGEHAMQSDVLKEVVHHDSHRLGGEPGTLVARRECHAELWGPRLVGPDVDRAVADERAVAAVRGRQLHPHSRLAEGGLVLFSEEPFGICDPIRRVP
jgi:hypothetical protein